MDNTLMKDGCYLSEEYKTNSVLTILEDLRMKIMKGRTEVSCDQTASKLWQTILKEDVTKPYRIHIVFT